MSERIRASIDAFVAAWNEVDGTKRATLLERACANGFVMCTSGRRIEGRAELDAMMSDFQRRFPSSRAIFASDIDVQGNLFRYAGVVESATGEIGGEALDTGEADDEGRIRTLFTFVGIALPPL